MRRRAGRGGEAGEGGVGGELYEIAGVKGAELGLIGGQGAGDGLDLAQRDRRPGLKDLIDAAREGQRPAVVKDPAGDRDLEGDGGGMLGRGAGAQLVMPMRAELRAPDALRAARGLARAESKVGEFADAQRRGALSEIEIHAASHATRESPKSKGDRVAGLEAGISFSR